MDKNGSSTAGSRILQGVAVHIENRRSTRASDGGVPTSRPCVPRGQDVGQILSPGSY